ncbi:MAG: hypothetical protein ACXW4O_16490 [Candidatus Binatia bacterium]
MRNRRSTERDFIRKSATLTYLTEARVGPTADENSANFIFGTSVAEINADDKISVKKETS